MAILEPFRYAQWYILSTSQCPQAAENHGAAFLCDWRHEVVLSLRGHGGHLADVRKYVLSLVVASSWAHAGLLSTFSERMDLMNPEMAESTRQG